MARRVELAELSLPDFGLPSIQPEIPAATYQTRIDTALDRAANAGYDALIVYGDREHAANVAYLTGYDPRFEETLLILAAGRKPILLLGNEGMSYSAVSPLDLERELYQTFSLLGQPRGESPMLKHMSSLLPACGRANAWASPDGSHLMSANRPIRHAHWKSRPSLSRS